MSERFERSALLEDDELQVYKATREATRPRRPQTAPAGGRHSSVTEATATTTHPVAPGKENQDILSKNQDATKEDNLNHLKAAILEVPNRFSQRPKSASVSGSSKPYPEPKADQCFSTEGAKVRPKSASVTSLQSRSAAEQAQKMLQRPKSAMAIGASRSHSSSNNEIKSAQVPRRPRSASTTSSMLSRSRSGSVSSCVSTAGSADAKQSAPYPSAPEWVGGNNNRRGGHGQTGPPAFPKRALRRTQSKAKARVGQEFFPLSKDLSMYNVASKMMLR